MKVRGVRFDFQYTINTRIVFTSDAIRNISSSSPIGATEDIFTYCFSLLEKMYETKFPNIWDLIDQIMYYFTTIQVRINYLPERISAKNKACYSSRLHSVCKL